MLKPRALTSGDRLAVVAPASPFTREQFDAGIAELVRLGFEPVYDESVFARQSYVAGSAAVRAAAIQRAWDDSSIAGLICVRGGYGSAQILPLLDAAHAKRACKAFIGYSDLTAILTFLTTTCGMTAFHGPMMEGSLEKGEAGYDRASFERALCRREPMGELAPAGAETLKSGEARGMLLGGTLTQLLAVLGTPYAFNPPNGHVLFLDEVGERPYRVDRMLLQLRQSGLLAKASAIVFNEMIRCDEPSGEVTARGTIAAVLADFPGPIVFGFPSGHAKRAAITLPLGVTCRVVASSSPKLIIEESAVS